MGILCAGEVCAGEVDGVHGGEVGLDGGGEGGTAVSWRLVVRRGLTGCGRKAGGIRWRADGGDGLVS